MHVRKDIAAMMQDLKFEKTKIVLAESNRQVRSNIRSMLHSMGFREPLEAENLEDLRAILHEEEPDIMLCDLDLAGADAGGDLYEMIANLRRCRMGRNPFMAVIATSWMADEILVNRSIDSGFDGFLVKPLSAERLSSRVRSLAKKSRSFIVSGDYVGPPRRSLTAPESKQFYELEVPNTLQLRAVGQLVDTRQFLGAINSIQKALLKIEKISPEISIEGEPARAAM